jgi:hypothetical protein
MFGASNDKSQPHTGPVTSPTVADHSINDEIPAAPAEAAPPANDVSSVFPAASASNDPFGTTPLVDDPAAAAEPVGAPAPANDTSSHATSVGSDLIDIKQQALEQLSPLVKHLEQSPEEKFKTTMMMIQASDDQSLVPEAFESAKQITDDKARAQALLDIINEINYFTQNHDQ